MVTKAAAVPPDAAQRGQCLDKVLVEGVQGSRRLDHDTRQCRARRRSKLSAGDAGRMQPQRGDVPGGDHLLDRREDAPQVVAAHVALQHRDVRSVGLIEREA